MKTSKRIRACRLGLGLTQEELGSRIGVQKAAINKYETGRIASIPSEKLIAMANLFRVTTDYLLGISDDPLNGFGLEDDEADSELPAKFHRLDPVEKTYIIGKIDAFLAEKE